MGSRSFPFLFGSTFGTHPQADSAMSVYAFMIHMIAFAITFIPVDVGFFARVSHKVPTFVTRNDIRGLISCDLWNKVRILVTHSRLSRSIYTVLIRRGANTNC